MDPIKVPYLHKVYQRIVLALPGLSWKVMRSEPSSETPRAPRKYGEALRILSDSLNKSPLPPLCLWVWLEKSKGIANVVEFLATCPNFMFQAALKEALQVIAYVYSSRFPNVDVNTLVDFPAFTMLNSCFSSCYPDIDFKGEASVIWQELNSINRYVRPLIFPARNPQKINDSVRSMEALGFLL